MPEVAPAASDKTARATVGMHLNAATTAAHTATADVHPATAEAHPAAADVHPAAPTTTAPAPCAANTEVGMSRLAATAAIKGDLRNMGVLRFRGEMSPFNATHKTAGPALFGTANSFRPPGTTIIGRNGSV
jgi:hypothetical protein